MAVTANDKPHSLTHMGNTSFDEVNQLNTVEIVGDDGTGTIRKVVVNPDGSINTASQSNTTTTGTLTGAGQTLVHTLSSGESALMVQITGTWSGIIGFEASADGTNYITHHLTNAATEVISSTTNSTNGAFFGGYAGFTKFRLTVASWTSGTANATIITSTGVQSVHLESPIPAGTNNIGDVDIASNALASSPLVGQKAMTGSAVQLQTNTLVNGVIITAKSTNTANILIGTSGVTTTADGSGNGYILEPGASVSFAGTNTNLLYAIGTSGDVLSFMGC